MILEWRLIPGSDGYYVSSVGGVRRHIGRLLALQVDHGGYLVVRIYLSGSRKTIRVSRAVCEAFHGPPPTPKHEAAHSNGNKKDNRKDNLSWKTKVENEADKVLHGTKYTSPKGSDSPVSKLTEKQRKEVYWSVLSPAETAAKFGISKGLVYSIQKDHSHAE